MYLNPDTTAILVADRRSSREAAARQRRSLVASLRQAVANRLPIPARLQAPADRTSVAAPPRAA